MNKIDALHSLAAAHIEASVRIYDKSPFMSMTHIEEACKLYKMIRDLDETAPKEPQTTTPE